MRKFVMTIMSCYLAAVPPAFAGQVAGTVTWSEGKVTATTNGVMHTLIPGDPVEEGDEISTAPNGQLHLRMKDDAYLALRPNAHLRIEGYDTRHESDGLSALYLLSGSMRAVTGWIGKSNPAKYTLRTPTASLGVRGTDYETTYVPEGTEGPGESPGTYNRVYEGEIVVEGEDARLTVKSGLSAFIARHKPPRLLPSPPDFLLHPPSLDEKLEAIKPELQERIRLKLEQIRKLQEQLRQQARLIRDSLRTGSLPSGG